MRGRSKISQGTSDNLILGATYLVSELLLSFLIASFVKLLEQTMAMFEIVFLQVSLVFVAFNPVRALDAQEIVSSDQ